MTINEIAKSTREKEVLFAISFYAQCLKNPKNPFLGSFLSDSFCEVLISSKASFSEVVNGSSCFSVEDIMLLSSGLEGAAGGGGKTVTEVSCASFSVEEMLFFAGIPSPLDIATTCCRLSVIFCNGVSSPLITAVSIASA